MFADSFCDSSWALRSRRSWTTLVSFTIQAGAVGLLLLIPLLYTQVLPQLQLAAPLVALTAPPGPPAPAQHPDSARPSDSNMTADGRVIQPPSIPRNIAQVTDAGPVEPADVGVFSVPGGTGNSRVANPIWGGTGDTSWARPNETTSSSSRQLLTSHMAEGNLIYRVQPIYPHLAIQTHTQGTVVLQAVISREGTIENLRLVSGPGMLVGAAMEAVRQWRYRPHVLNGQPVEVETQITVKFILSNG